jgi:Family of unknown function (DUF5318)
MDASNPTSRVDYSLARRAVLREYHAGQVSRFEICDAHPDLLRAARYSGEKTSEACPICDAGPLILIAYAFSDTFPKRENGKVWPRDDVAPLMKLGDARLYTVEVCLDCSWNHLLSQMSFGGRSRAKRPRRASE